MRHAGSQALAKSSIRQSISVFLLFLICSLFALKINSLLISLSQTPCQIPFSIPNQKKKKTPNYLQKTCNEIVNKR